jgi:two-component system chemotaxis sensor kinase CheA
MSMDIDQVLHVFIEESRELLAEMEAALLGVADAPEQAELVNAIFRAAHTIKGSAGMFGLDDVVAFTHVVESVLDQVREGKLPIDEPLVVLLLACGDHIAGLVDGVAAGATAADAATCARGAPLTAQLHGYLDASGAGAGALALGDDAGTAGAAPLERIDAAHGESDHWHISLRFGADVLRNGMDPLSFLRYLGQLGRIVGIATVDEALPAGAGYDAESCYLGFEIAFQSAADKAAIDNVFDFVRDDCSIRILAPYSRVDDYLMLIAELPEEDALLGAMLVRCGSVTAQELAAALRAQSDVSDASDAAVAPLLGAILVEQGAVRPRVVEAAAARQKQVSEAKVAAHRSVRVDADKLDHLINLVGELIIAGASATLIARRTQIGELLDCTATLAGLVEEIRDSALQLRMVKIGATFSRFQRVVHDVSREIGKDIRLAVSGEDTELDKTVVEKIADPLTHLVRNALDHGIESAALRAERGKPAQGCVTLNAFHDSGSIVIEVSDDGGGLKRERILAKAVERGLVEAGRVLSDKDIFGLIFEPGFSTAEQVTNLSGRGVGMDVVKRNITALRGSVSVASVDGVGTTVTVRLPLTLAIINGFQVGLGKSVFVIPMDMVEECVEFHPEPGRDYINLRGQVLPFVRLRERFAVKGVVGRRESIVVVRYGTRKAGIVVDTLLGEFQTVIKPLGALFADLKCISGSSILGSGEVALILDVAALLGDIEGDGGQLAA